MKMAHLKSPLAKAFLALGLALSVAACGPSKPMRRSEVTPLRTPESVGIPEGHIGVAQVYDPFEGWNRGVYRFNYYFDKYIFLPVVRVYNFIMPDPLADGISNMLANIYDVNNLINSILQLKPKVALRTTARLLMNTTVGIGGFVDVATPQGLYKQKEDFGQTLGRYGVGHGPYLVLPIFGPSNLRDGVGIVGDSVINYFTDPVNLATDREYTLYYNSLKAIDTRRNTAFRYYGSGSPFEYTLVRWLYTDYREIEIAK